MNNMYDRCPNCLNPYDGSGNPCVYCGQDVMGYSAPAGCLPPFTILQDKYMLGRVLGKGGFGITYIGYDMNLATYVAIKEYFPESISTRGTMEDIRIVSAQAGKEGVYEKNLNRFVDEARNISKFYNLPGIVSVRNFFFENGTAYIVMDYIAGINMKSYLMQNGGRMDENTVLYLMKPVLESLYEVHKQGLIHRDISPDNIMFDDNGSIKLIDFGSVRALSTDGDANYTVMLKHGYAPQEQYFTKGNQGPWTDVYSICATMYKILTGVVPPNCIERMTEDTYLSPSQCGAVVSENTERVINKGLSVNIADRYQSVGELMQDLFGATNENAVVHQESYVEKTEAQLNRGTKKKLPIIIVSTIAALALICVIVKIFVLDKDDKKVTTEEPVTTEAIVSTITDATTEVTTEVTTEEAVAFEGSWEDFTFKIDDDVYELPMTYEQWAAYGWEPETVEFTLSTGEIREVVHFNDQMACSAILVNYNEEPAGMEQCHVIGFMFYSDIHKVKERSIITFPNDVVLCTNNADVSSTAEQILEKYGEPTDSTSNDYVSQSRYYSDNNSYIIFRCNNDSGLYRVSYATYNVPDGVNVATNERIEEVPMNLLYQVPSATADRFDDIFTIDGVNYKISCPVSQFIDNGWSIEEPGEYLEPGLMSAAVLVKGETRLQVTLANYTVYELTYDQAYVQDIYITADDLAGMQIVCPGGVTIGMESSKISQLYSDMESGYGESKKNESKEYMVYIYVPDGKIETEMVALPADTEEDDGEETSEDETVYYVSEYYYSHNRLSTQSDCENTEYITGKMVE